MTLTLTDTGDGKTRIAIGDREYGQIERVFDDGREVWIYRPIGLSESIDYGSTTRAEALALAIERIEAQ